MGIVGLVYGIVLLLALQRYVEHKYILENHNDFYLGSTQIDADFVICCYLVSFHLWRRHQAYKEEQERKEKENEPH